MKENIEKTNDMLLSNIMLGFLEDDSFLIQFNHTQIKNRYENGLISLEDIEMVYSLFIEQ